MTMNMLSLSCGTIAIAKRWPDAERVIRVTDDEFEEAISNIPAFAERAEADPGCPVLWGGALWATASMLHRAASDEAGANERKSRHVDNRPESVKSAMALLAGTHGLVGSLSEEHRNCPHIVLPDDAFDQLAATAEGFVCEQNKVWVYWMTAVWAKESDIRRWWSSVKTRT